MTDLALKFRCIRVIHRDEIDIHIYSRDADGSLTVVTTMNVQRIAQGSAPPDGAGLSLRMDEAQRLVDELWDAGLRPSEGSGSAGSLAATQKHLLDMRMIAFAALARDGIEAAPEGATPI